MARLYIFLLNLTTNLLSGEIGHKNVLFRHSLWFVETESVARLEIFMSNLNTGFRRNISSFISITLLYKWVLKNSEISIWVLIDEGSWKSDTSCEWAPYRQSGGTDGYRCNCEDGFYGWKCELRLIFLLQKKVQSIFPHILKIFISACSTDRTGCHPVGTEKCEPAHMCRNSFSCDTVAMKRFQVHQSYD